MCVCVRARDCMRACVAIPRVSVCVVCVCVSQCVGADEGEEEEEGRMAREPDGHGKNDNLTVGCGHGLSPSLCGRA